MSQRFAWATWTVQKCSPKCAITNAVGNLTMATSSSIVCCALLLVSSIFAVSLCATDSELTQKYRFNSVMDQSGNYKLYWSFDKQQENVTFAVRVRTTGWVGFGLSPNGLMPNSDVIIGWVDSNGQAHMHVRWFALLIPVASLSDLIILLVVCVACM